MRALILATRPTEPNRGDPSPGSLLVRAMIDRGHEVHLVCAGDEPLRSYGALTVQPVHAARSIGVPAYSSASFDAARSFRPEVVLAERPHLGLGRAVAAVAKARFVPLLSDGLAGDTSAVRRVLTPLDGRLIRNADGCIAFGRLQADAALQRGARRVVELPGVSGIDPVACAPTGWLRRHLRLDGGVLVVAWGELGPEHGTDILIEGVKVAADADTDVHAAIFGGDETSIDRYNAKAERLGIQNRVHLLGEWPASKLHTLLHEADIVVEPSVVPGRTPRAFYSMLASNRPVVLAEAPGRARLIDAAACVITPADRLGIGHALADLAASPAEQTRLASAAGACIRRSYMYHAFVSALSDFERLVVEPQAALESQEPTTQSEGLRA